MLIFLVAALIIAVLALILALQNAVPIAILFLLWEFESSLALVMLIAVIIGAVIATLALLPTLIGGKWSTAKKNRRLAELESQLAESTKMLKEAETRLQAHAAESSAEEPEGLSA